jgi:isopentenyldiphosphate isomerase
VKDRQQHQIIDVYQIDLNQDIELQIDNDEVVKYHWLEAKKILKLLTLYLKELELLKTQDEIDNFKHKLIPEQVDTFIKLLENDL